MGLLFVASIILSLHICSSSGTSTGFSYDAATHESLVSRPLRDTLPILQHNKASSSLQPQLDSKNVVNHDSVTPVTIPSPNQSPNIISVPSTNPTTTLPTTSPITIPSTNPATTPVTFPSPDPTTTPITAPATNPVTNPATAPVTVPPLMPVTNPVTTPTNPVNPPVTNPVTTNPFSPPTSVTPAIGIPNTAPLTPATGAPTGSGQSWCVAKSGVGDEALQDALDYACGMGGADCSGIQMSGSCYNPNSLQAHASYAFNSYYQKNPVATSCDFGGTAMIVTTNPSTGTCTYPSSSSASGLNPASGAGAGTGAGTGTGTGTGTGIGTGIGSTGSAGTGAAPTTGLTPTYNTGIGSGPSVLNTNNSGGSNTVFGSDSPMGTIGSGSLSRPAQGWILLAVAYAMRLLQ